MGYEFPIVVGRVIRQTRSLGVGFPRGKTWAITQITAQITDRGRNFNSLWYVRCCQLSGDKFYKEFLLNEDFEILDEMADISFIKRQIMLEFEGYLLMEIEELMEI